MFSVAIAAVVGLVIGAGLVLIIYSSRCRDLQKQLSDSKKSRSALQENFDQARREREQNQKNVDSQLRTKDLQLKQLRDENEELKRQLAIESRKID